MVSIRHLLPAGAPGATLFVAMKSNKTGVVTPQAQVKPGPSVKSPPKTTFGAALAKKSAELAEQEQRRQEEKELLEEVGVQMSKSVLDMPDGANLEPEKTDDDEDRGEGW